MSEAEPASLAASARADTILGIHRPASAVHARFVRMETWLRYAVPAVLATFLLSMIAVAGLHLQTQRDETVRSALSEVEALARLTSASLAAARSR